MIRSSQPTRSSRNWLAAWGLVVGLLLAGCGSGKQATSTDATAGGSDTSADNSTVTDTTDATDPADETGGSGGDGCDLISDDLVTQVLGIEVVRREANTDATTGGVSCIKGTERVTDLTQSSYVSVSRTPGGAAFFDQTIEGAPTEPVPGVADRAEFLAAAASLIIAAGEDLVTVQVVKAGVPSSLDDCLAVAEEVLGNL
ncbi:MAG: hypothetical protein H0T54_02685 [Geodermatophilaceae bacterium]|nr:hypothetical protein [Geodermatophilaceae bacterium]